MSRKQLGSLAVLNAGAYLIGNSILPLLPLYLGELGAQVADSGLYLSLIFAALMAGSLIGGWLSNRTNQRKAMLLVSAIVSMAALLLLTQFTSLTALLLLAMVIWFVGGLTTASVNILAGLHAPAGQRGRVFGAIGVTVGLSQFAGGLIAGPVVSRWGFQGLFLLLAMMQVAPILAALFVDDRIQAPRPIPSTTGRRSTSEGYWLLLAAAFLVYIVNFTVVLGRPLAMQAAGLDAGAISSTVAIAGLVALPLPFVMGWLSDRIGRKSLLALAWALFASGLFLLAFANTLALFWLSAALMSAMTSTLSLSSALVADLVRRSYLSTGLSRLSATPWLGAIVGSSVAGVVIAAFGLRATFLVAAVLPIVSALMALMLHQPQVGSLDTLEISGAKASEGTA